MKIFYSPGTRGFYHKDVHGDSMPSDVVGISEEEYASLLSKQEMGKRIALGTHGRPIAMDQTPTTEELSIRLRRLRDDALRETDGLISRHRDEIDLGISTTLTTDQFRSLLQWRSDLRNITTMEGFPNISLPDRPV